MTEHNPQATFKSRKRAAQVFTKPKPVAAVRSRFTALDWFLILTIVTALCVIASVTLSPLVEPLLVSSIPRAEAVERCAAFDDVMGPLLTNAGMQYPEGHACAPYL